MYLIWEAAAALIVSARKQVGESGCVIGVDMSPEMVKLARQNAERSGYKNIEFRLGRLNTCR